MIKHGMNRLIHFVKRAAASPDICCVYFAVAGQVVPVSALRRGPWEILSAQRYKPITRHL
jgi:hypothetical protein